MTLTILSVSTESIKAAPFTEASIQESIESLLPIKSKDEFLNDLLSLLSKKSSKHKFIVNLTAISAIGSNQINVANKFGSVWDNEKDGYFNYKITLEDEEVLLVSITWVYIG